MLKGTGKSSSRFRTLIKQLPDSITSLDLLGTGNLDSNWKFPLGLTSLTVNYLRQIVQLPDQPPFTLPPNLRSLSLNPFSQTELLSSLLPASLTSLTLSAPTKERAFEGIQWPAGLCILKLVPSLSPQATEIDGSAALRYWNPPPQLTDLDIASQLLYLDDAILPPTLIRLRLSNYIRSLAGVVFPPSLKHLSVLNQEIGLPSLKRGMWQHPPELTSLDITFYEDNLHLPSTLTRLSTTSAFHPTSFIKLSEALPNSLLELNLALLRLKPDDQFDTFILPPKLRCLQLSWINCLEKCCAMSTLPKAEQFPASLKELWALDFTFSRFSRKDPTKVQQILEWAANSLPPGCAFLY